MNPIPAVERSEPPGSGVDAGTSALRPTEAVTLNGRGDVLSWRGLMAFTGCAALCFHAAYATPWLSFMIVGNLVCLLQLTRAATWRRAFYSGFVAGLAAVAVQLTCFWSLFGPPAIALWAILAFWTGLFVALARLVLLRLGPIPGGCLIPFLWTGLEYFRSELYYLRFSWLSIGFTFSETGLRPLFHSLGMYGVGFLAVSFALLFLPPRPGRRLLLTRIAFVSLVLILGNLGLALGKHGAIRATTVSVAGIQMEFPTTTEVVEHLEALIKSRPETELVVLSEYTFDGPVPEPVKRWCALRKKYLVVGGKDPAPKADFFDTAFVVDPSGQIVFRQAKAVPIQFFKDGLPAEEQRLWDSPWGKIGMCVCYDLSYARVVDPLVTMGAQALVVPTMDIVDWGKREHQLHGRVAPIRSAEYGIPVFRVASSGISQHTDASGGVLARAGFPGRNELVVGNLVLASKGSLPLDRWLAPISVGVTALIGIWLMAGAARRSRNSRRQHTVAP